MGKITAIFKLTRIEHSIMLIIAVIAAELISGKLPNASILLLSIITPVFISMGAFAINDYFDIGVDRANRKMRPLVTGELNPGDALYITAASMIIGIVAGFMINIYCFAISVIFATLSLLYSYRLKELPLIGNSYIAFSMAIPFIFGNYVVTSVPSYAILVIFSLVFISGLAREINGTMRDYEGDKIRNAKTLPGVVGLRASGYMALLLYLISIFISVYLFLFMPPFKNNLVYLVLIAVSDLMLLYSGIMFALMKKRYYSLVRNVSLGGMALALVCLLISALVYIQTPL